MEGISRMKILSLPCVPIFLKINLSSQRELWLWTPLCATNQDKIFLSSEDSLRNDCLLSSAVQGKIEKTLDVEFLWVKVSF